MNAEELIQFEEEIIKQEIRNSGDSDDSISSGEEENPGKKHLEGFDPCTILRAFPS